MTARPAADFHARAASGWGGNPPDWIKVLADACTRETQAGVARRLDVSGSRLSQALAGTYPGDMGRLEEIVRGALMGETVNCPVLGEIGRDRCLSEQRKPFTAASSVRTRLHRACRAGCPHSRIVKERS